MEEPEVISPVITKDIIYPSLLKRVQSTFIDGILTFIFTGLLVVLASAINDDNVGLKIAAIIIGISYDPLMMAFSRSIGQRITGMKVITADSGEAISLFAAYIRYIIKAMLGWLSFVTMHSNTQRRAIHDLAANSVVIMANA